MIAPQILTSDERIAALEQRVAALEARGAPRTAAPRQPSAGGNVASDADLDGEFGDPTVRSDPRHWTGPSQVGRRYSQCPVAFLGQLAHLLDWQADRCEDEGKLTGTGKPKAPFLRKDAALARGWRRRLEAKASGTRPAQQQPQDDW